MVSIYSCPQMFWKMRAKPDHPVSIAMKGVSLKSALEMILKPLNLDYVVDNEVVKIMPAYEANRTYKMRIYPVADLCSTPEDYDILRDVIRNARLGEWKPDGINQLGPSVTSFGNGVSAQNYAFEGEPFPFFHEASRW